MSISAIPFSMLTQTKRIDAECYQPQYLENIKFLESKSKYPSVMLGSLLNSITGGATPLGAEYPDSGVPFIRVQNIMPGYLDMNDVVYISPEVHKGELKRSQLKSGDVLLTITGMSYGKAAYVPPNFGEANINQHSVRMAIKSDVLPEYVAMFLNSRFGKLQSDRKVTGDTRPALDYEEIKTILIPVPPKPKQEIIQRKLHEAENKRRLAQRLYANAEHLLAAELGLDKLDLSESLFNVRQVSEVLNSERMDAEYYKPKYERLLRYLQKTKQAVRLNDWIREPLNRGTQPEYSDDGDVLVINSQHVGKTHIELEDNRNTTKEFCNVGSNNRALVRQFDVLLNSTGYITIGRAQTLLDDVQAMVDGHVTIIRPTEGLDPIYLGLYLNSLPGQLQTEQGWTGSSGQIELRTEVIANYTIWKAPDTIQKKIRKLVEDAHQARKEAKRLLAEAKKEVEKLIEGK